MHVQGDQELTLWAWEYGTGLTTSTAQHSKLLLLLHTLLYSTAWANMLTSQVSALMRSAATLYSRWRRHSARLLLVCRVRA